MLLEIKSEAPSNKLMLFMSCHVMTGFGAERGAFDEGSKRNNYLIWSELVTINFQYLQIIMLPYQLALIILGISV